MGYGHRQGDYRLVVGSGRYFKIIRDDNAVYIIRHDFETFNWELTFYQTADGPFRNNDIDGKY